jgi:hypothetical protein
VKERSKTDRQGGVRVALSLVGGWHAHTGSILLHYSKNLGPLVVGGAAGFGLGATFGGLLYARPVLGIATNAQKLQTLFQLATSGGVGMGAVVAIPGQTVRAKWEAFRLLVPDTFFEDLYPQQLKAYRLSQLQRSMQERDYRN